jgi:hypothetical protein
MDLKGWEKLGWPKFWRVANCVIFMSAKFQKIKKNQDQVPFHLVQPDSIKYRANASVTTVQLVDI